MHTNAQDHRSAFIGFLAAYFAGRRGSPRANRQPKYVISLYLKQYLSKFQKCHVGGTPYTLFLAVPKRTILDVHQVSILTQRIPKYCDTILQSSNISNSVRSRINRINRMDLSFSPTRAWCPGVNEIAGLTCIQPATIYIPTSHRHIDQTFSE